MKKSLTINQINIGDKAARVRVFTQEDVVNFAKLSGDDNPIHLSEDYASQTSFKNCIVHGHFVSSIYSDILGSELPGLGTIFLKQNVTYIKPVYLGDTITATVTVVDKILEKNRVICDTKSYNQNGDLVIVGRAEVLPPLKEVPNVY